MSAPALQSPDQLHPDEKPLAEYVPVSRLAVAALALGLASPLILASPLLVVVPLAGLAVAIVALRQIALSDLALQGRWVATVGLCLATFFLGWGVTRQMSRQLTMAEQAERFADSWLALVRDGKLHEADQLRHSRSSRIEGAEALAQHYAANKEAAEGFRSLFESEPMKSFRASGGRVVWRLDGIAGQSRSGGGDDLVLKYEYQAPGEDSWQPMWITVARTLEGSAQTPNWEIRSAEATLPMRLQ
jgi:hypothetical protein